MAHTPVLLGAHMSIAGGIENAYMRGASIGCTAIQFFTHSNRQWAMKPLTQETIEAVHQVQKETGISHAMVHGSYLMNLASTSEETRRKSRDMLLKELEYCAALSVPYVVLHPGSHQNTQEGIALVADGINDVFAAHSSPVTLLLENMAGQGSQLGRTFEELAALKAAITESHRVAFCIDICHLWAAGYDFSTKEGYTKVFDQAHTILGQNQIKALHVNDSKQPCGARVDRHADIGQGTIGMEAFTLLMNDPNFTQVPKVLETPDDELSQYKENMDLLESLIA